MMPPRRSVFALHTQDVRAVGGNVSTQRTGGLPALIQFLPDAELLNERKGDSAPRSGCLGLATGIPTSDHLPSQTARRIGATCSDLQPSRAYPWLCCAPHVWLLVMRITKRCARHPVLSARNLPARYFSEAKICGSSTS